MKKKYIKPESTVMVMEIKQQLLAGSGVEGSSIYDETTNQATGY